MRYFFGQHTAAAGQQRSRNTGLGWHVDYPYHDLDPGYWGEVDSPLGVQVLICLDEFTSANGGTMFRTNTHKLLQTESFAASSWAGSKHQTTHQMDTCQIATLQSTTLVHLAVSLLHTLRGGIGRFEM